MDYYLRPPEMKDIAGLNALRRMPGVFENILGLPSERLSSQEKFLAAMDEREHLLVAILREPDGGETLIGVSGMSVNRNPRTRHAASFGMMVHTEYQNRGVGTRLLEAILDVADNWLMLVRLELTVFTDNVRAITLYEKHGFVKEGVKRAASIRYGEYADVFMMARLRLPGGMDKGAMGYTDDSLKK